MRIKDYVLQSVEIIQNGEIDQDQLEYAKKIGRWFNTKDKPRTIDDVSIEIDKSFIMLCRLMEEKGSICPEKYTVIQYYGKLNYIQKEVESWNSQSK